VHIEGRDVTHLPPEMRPTAMVFQDYALFPHLDVRRNIAFGLRSRRRTPSADRVTELVRMLRLEAVLDRPISALSGGQKQRVALARALSVEPSILLLDEPLGALDASLRKEVQAELKLLQRRLGLTFLFVTHSQAEALALSDRIVVMNSGRVEQISTPEELCSRPVSRFVARFIGRNLVLDGKVIDRRGTNVKIETRLGELVGQGEPYQGSAVALALNLDRIEVRRENTAKARDSGLSIKAQIVGRRNSAGRINLHVVLSDGSEICIDRREDRIDVHALDVGSPVDLCWKPEDASLVRG
jgi:ABC-type Fe3+/spermidine/putrescine transport system ATPase subunit